MDIRLLSLLIPACASGLGFFCFAVLAFSFTELAALPTAFRTALVLVGSFALAFGAEVGTLAQVVEIYRRGETLGKWDKLALIISVLSTVGAFILAFATLLGVKATWGAAVQLYGPIVLGLLAALDSYGGFMELGLYLHIKEREALADRARRREEWRMSIRDEVWKARQKAKYNRKLAEVNGESPELQQARADAEKYRQALQAANAELDAADKQLDALRAQPTAGDGELSKRDAIVTYYRANPLASQADAAAAVGCSRAYVGKTLTALEGDGAIKRNGKGVEVLH